MTPFTQSCPGLLNTHLKVDPQASLPMPVVYLSDLMMVSVLVHSPQGLESGTVCSPSIWSDLLQNLFVSSLVSVVRMTQWRISFLGRCGAVNCSPLHRHRPFTLNTIHPVAHTHSTYTTTPPPLKPNTALSSILASNAQPTHILTPSGALAVQNIQGGRSLCPS